MTTMAMTQPPLKRLFERLDFAPTPKHESLSLVLETWEAKRRGVLAPSRHGLTLPETRHIAEEIFVHRKVEGERDYSLAEGQKAAGRLLGPCEIGARLRGVRNRREAVRLRRLFDEVLRIGEPVLAEFILVEQGRHKAAVEILAAPLSEDTEKIDSILAIASVRRFEKGAIARQPRAGLGRGAAIFALGSSRGFGENVARLLKIEVSPHEEREFEDGEHKLRPMVNVRERDVYVIYGLQGEKNRTGGEKLCRLLFFIGALKDAGAARVTAVAPYLCYARKDRQTKPRDPITTRYVAQMFEAVGTDRIITIDVHNPAAFQNAFRCNTITLDAHAVFARHIAAEIGEEAVAVVSPDLGGEKRAELFRQRLEKLLDRPIAKGFMDKYRSMGKVSGDIFAGDVLGRTVIVLDDLISTGGTMARTAAACRKHGAAKIWIVATHSVFSPGAVQNLLDASIDRIIIADTTPLPLGEEDIALKERLTTVSVTGLVAEAIRRCHLGGSIVELLETGP